MVLGLLLISSEITSSQAFTSPIFQETAALQRTAPSKTEGVEIELPDFDEFFGRIQAVSPLAKLVIEGGGSGEGGGFAKVDETGEYWHGEVPVRDLSFAPKSSLNVFSFMQLRRG